MIYATNQDDIPEHLKKVVKTTLSNTKRNHDAEAIGELISAIHPARSVSQQAARQIDGAKKSVSEELLARARKEKAGGHGRSLQAFAVLYELFEAAEPDE